MPFCPKAVFAMPCASAHAAASALADVIYKVDKECGTDSAFAGNHRCCAERRLLDTYVQQGRKQGVPPHKIVAWVRRKLGGGIVVWRRTVDGAIGCAIPCLFCTRELQRFDLQVHCPLGDGKWFSGKLTDAGAPTPRLTGGQQKVLRSQGWTLCDDPVPAAAEKPEQQQRPRGTTNKRRSWRQDWKKDPQQQQQH